MTEKLPTGRQVLELARSRIGCRYVFGATVAKNDAECRGPFDCAEFVAWVIYTVSDGRILYGCSTDDPAQVKHADAYTGYFERDCTRRGHGIPVSEAEKIEGAIVLRTPRAGRRGHIVFSDGKGGTIEAHSSADGVIASTLKGPGPEPRAWTVGILIPGIDYTPQGATGGEDAGVPQ